MNIMAWQDKFGHSLPEWKTNVMALVITFSEEEAEPKRKCLGRLIERLILWPYGTHRRVTIEDITLCLHNFPIPLTPMSNYSDIVKMVDEAERRIKDYVDCLVASKRSCLKNYGGKRSVLFPRIHATHRAYEVQSKYDSIREILDRICESIQSSSKG